MKTLPFLSLLLLAFASNASTDAVYRCSKPGQPNAYQSTPLPGATCKRIMLDANLHAVVPGSRVVTQTSWKPSRLFMDKHAEPITRHASTFGVDPALVRAVIHAESAFNHRAVSPKGAQGLMQLIPDTAERFGVADPFSPDENIEGGVRYLSWLMKRYKGDVVKVAAAYNAGEGRVDRYGGVPPYKETQQYVQRVQALYASYRTAQPMAAAGP